MAMQTNDERPSDPMSPDLAGYYLELIEYMESDFQRRGYRFFAYLLSMVRLAVDEAFPLRDDATINPPFSIDEKLNR